jgi:pimeloyl-ACP methyl ester carboxylesterase
MNPRRSTVESSLLDSAGLRPDVFTIDSKEPAIKIRGFGVGSGEPVVFLHGITLAALHWVSVMSRLQSFRCIALDMPGHGGSEQFDFGGVDLREWHVRLLASCLDELGIRDAHFVGHSYGALFAMWLAVASPARVRSIVSVGAPSVAFGARPDMTLSLLARPFIGRAVLSMPTPLALYRSMLSMSLGHHAVTTAPAELINATYLGSRQPGFARTVSSYLLEQLSGKSSDRYVLSQKDLSEIRCPILILWGNEDRRYQSPEEGRRVASVIPACQFDVVPGGHEPWLDDLEACTSRISEFLEDRVGQRNSTDLEQK